MNYHYFGRTGIQVSEICLGTMSFGNEADLSISHKLMDIAFGEGINFFDTADIYNKGDSESIIGSWMGDKRENIVLATKTHYPSGGDRNDKGSSRRHIMQGVEGSLRRLQTDYVDVLYLHHWDANTDLEQTLSALNDLVTQGKVLYVAVSNFAAWQCAKAIQVSGHRGWAPITAIQPMYNLVKRVAEIEILPMAQEEGIAVCPYSPMGAGLLTGKYHRKEVGRITQNTMYAARYKNPEYMETAGRFVAYAEEHGHQPASLAVKWAASHPAVTSAIVGCWNPAQLEIAVQSQEIELDAEARQAITDLSVAPPNATDREDASHLKITNMADRK
ncbi:MAG: aldo/keto reductase [Candidatus Hydrogenedentota bacterium]